MTKSRKHFTWIVDIYQHKNYQATIFTGLKSWYYTLKHLQSADNNDCKCFCLLNVESHASGGVKSTK